MTTTVQAGWAIELIGLCKHYRAGWGRTTPALEALTLRLAPGQVLGLLGPNGSGKSTVLKLLAGLMVPSVGECRIAGQPAGSREARASIGYLSEQPRMPLYMTGRAWLEFGAGLSGLDSDVVRARVEAELAEHELGAVADRKIGTYSKGMRQRLGLAQALVHNPSVILLDEPASGLDPAGRLALGRTLRALAARGRTVVFSSHLLAQAEEWCDRVALLGHGRLLREGTPAELLGLEPVSAVQPSGLEKLYLETLHAHG